MTWHDHGILFDSSWISKRKTKQNKTTITTREHNQSLRQDIPWVNNMKPHQWYFPWIENEILWVTSHPLTFWWDRLEEPQGTDTSLVLQWPPGLPDRGISCCSTLFSPFSTNFRTPGRALKSPAAKLRSVFSLWDGDSLCLFTVLMNATEEGVSEFLEPDQSREPLPRS